MVENRNSRWFFAPNFRKFKNWWPCDWRYYKFAINPQILYEQKLCKKLISGLQSLPGIKIRGITDPSAMDRRVPTVSFSVEGRHPDQLAKALGDKNIFVWSGHNYALEAVRVMGLLEKGGLVRVGPVHYNTEEEIEKFFEELEPILWLLFSLLQQIPISVSHHHLEGLHNKYFKKLIIYIKLFF